MQTMADAHDMATRSYNMNQIKETDTKVYYEILD